MKTLVRIMGINTVQNTESNANQEHHSHTPISRQQLTNIKLPKQTADLLRVYCIFNNRKITEYVTDLLEEHLAEFRKEMAREHERWRH